MALKISQQYVADPSRRTFAGTNPVDFITVHGTANRDKGATAQAHANLLSRYGVDGSWHATSDDLGTIESYKDDAMCWHAGDGSGPGNKRSIAVEICVNHWDDQEKQVEAYKSAAFWVATKMVKHSVPLSRIKQHHDFSPWSKNCPRELRENLYWTWGDFLAAVAAYVLAIKAGEVLDEVVASRPKPPVIKPAGIDEDGWWGSDTTRALQKALGTPVDGEVWSQSIRWEDDNPGLTSGWKWTEDPKGSTVMRAFQAWIGLPVDQRDGLIGPNTIKQFQRKMRSFGYTGAIDGELWKQSATIKALQKALNQGKVK